jgi:predicted  nucleic acid-binding Zn-ribbon protein
MSKGDDLKKEIDKAQKALEKAREENKTLRDEVNSLWAMMDEITKSDIQNFSHLLDELKSDVVTRSLMVTKKKADC